MNMISSPAHQKDKQMKTTSLKGIFLVSALLALVSCAPQAFVVRPEMRGASKSGLNLNGKTFAVVYVTGNEANENAFNAAVADGFATRLEEDYFGGSREVGLFKMASVPGADFSAKDTLVNLVMESGKDVVFLFDIPELGSPIVGEPLKVTSTKPVPADSAYVSNVAMPFTTKVYVYDSMNKEDKVFGFTGSKSLATDVYSDGKASKNKIAAASLRSILEMAEKAGSLAAASFLSTWVQDSFYVIYYDGAEKAWNTAANYAYSFEWDKAIKEWMTLVGNKNSEKRSCAAYNIALGCFMSGQPGLALEWLDRSDKDMPVSLSKQLRDKIKQYTGR